VVGVKVYYGNLFFKEVLMKSKAVLAPVVVFVLAVSPAVMWAQNAGFRIGIAPPPVGFPPPQAPAVAIRGTFTMVPSFALPAPQAPILPVPLIPNSPTIIVPNRVVVNPGPVILVAPNPIQPGLPFNPQAGFVPQTGLVPQFFGMPRAEVLRRLGQPTVTIMTSTGETLYFTGGVTVILQNGVVIGPR
jgi:hypothetical protein